MTGDSVQKIKDRISIIDVISPYVELHQAGKNMKGKSPFTTEKTPSFYVSPDRGMYYCFSSSQGGDMFTFIQKMEGVDFKGALKILADKAGVELVPEDPKKRDHRDTLYQTLEEAVRFFEKKLAEQTNVLAYLSDRAVKTETIKKWRVGYAPDDWRQLKDHLNASGFADEILVSAGLIKQSEPGKQPYDVFRDRVMFPIMDASGRPIAFTGRTMSKESDVAKYLNSPETELFNKSDTLFGYDKAKQGIYKLGFSLIVEGQFDVILSHQAGYNNTVAVSGTAFTSAHASLLQRLSNRVVLALDADKAGISAVKRAANVLLPRGIDLKVAQIHGGKDPADLVKEDPKLLRKDIGEAKHVIEFLLQILKEEVKDDRMYKIRARDEILPFILQMESAIERDHFANIIAEAIGTTTDAIRNEVGRLEKAKKEEPREEIDRSNEPKKETPKQEIMNRKEDLITFLSVAEELIEENQKKDLIDGFVGLMNKTPKEVRDYLKPEKRSEMTFTIEQRWSDINPRFIREEWQDRLSQLKNVMLKEEVNQLKNDLLQAEQAGDENKTSELLQKLNEIRSKM